jgi:hypothetical protein
MFKTVPEVPLSDDLGLFLVRVRDAELNVLCADALLIPIVMWLQTTGVLY